MFRKVILLLLLATVFGAEKKVEGGEIKVEEGKKEDAKKEEEIPKKEVTNPTKDAKETEEDVVLEDCVKELKEGASYYLRVNDPQQKIFLVAQRPIVVPGVQSKVMGVLGKTKDTMDLKAIPLEQIKSNDVRWEIQKFEMDGTNLKAQFNGDKYAVLGQYGRVGNALYLEDHTASNRTTASEVTIERGMLKVGDTFIRAGAGPSYKNQVWGSRARTEDLIGKTPFVKFKLKKGKDYHHVCLVEANASTYLDEAAKKTNLDVQQEWYDKEIEAQRQKWIVRVKETGDEYTDHQFDEVKNDFKAEFDRLMSFYLYPNETLMRVAFKKLWEVYYDYVRLRKNQKYNLGVFKSFLKKIGDLEKMTVAQIKAKAVKLAMNVKFHDQFHDLVKPRLAPGLEKFTEAETPEEAGHLNELQKHLNTDGLERLKHHGKLKGLINKISGGATPAEVAEQVKKEEKEFHDGHAKAANLTTEEYEKVRSENKELNLIRSLAPHHLTKVWESLKESKGKEVAEAAIVEILEVHVKKEESSEDQENAEKYKAHGKWCLPYVKKWAANCGGADCLRERFEKVFQARNEMAKECNDDEEIKKVFDEAADESDNEDGFFAKVAEKAKKIFPGLFW